jgi:hypothetical protein
LADGFFTFSTDAFSIQKHLNKTLKSSRMINDKTLVDRFVRSAPDKVKWLSRIHVGMPDGTPVIKRVAPINPSCGFLTAHKVKACH